MIEQLLIWIYSFIAILLATYTIGHGVLLIQYWRTRHHTPELPIADDKALPHVTVQLPIYNEQHVALRLLDAVAALDYPTDKLHIQLLDDSTDNTTQLLQQHCEHYPQHDIQHIRRDSRTGYKAGALEYGLSQTESPFVAIFDADFIPPPDFLRQTMPYLLADDALAVVQTRWGHLNAEANALTRAQVLSIDNHFIIEQTGRNRSGWMLPFNGTGGVWRAAAIHDAGGWSAATLTEDLDLSFRAQLRGWYSLLLPNLVVDGELPPQLAAYRQQQARWAQGSSQCLRRLLLPVWTSDQTWSTRLMATHHLAQYIPQLLMLLLLLLAPFMLITDAFQHINLAALGIIGLIPPLMYVVSQRAIREDWYRSLAAFPALLLIGTGLIWHNSVAVLRGFVTLHSPFQRTPKFVQNWQASQYALNMDKSVVVELALMVYALWGAWLAWDIARPLVPYLLLHGVAFGTVIVWDAVDQWRIARQPSSSYTAHTTRL